MTADSVEQFQSMQDKGVSTIIQKPIDITRIIKMIGELEKKGTVFVVDDSENDRSLLTDILPRKVLRC